MLSGGHGVGDGRQVSRHEGSTPSASTTRSRERRQGLLRATTSSLKGIPVKFLTLPLLALVAALFMGSGQDTASADSWYFCDPGRPSSFAFRHGEKGVNDLSRGIRRVKATFEPPFAYREPGSANNSHIRMTNHDDAIRFGFSNSADGTNMIWSQWSLNDGASWQNFFYGPSTANTTFEMQHYYNATHRWFDLYVNGAYWMTHTFTLAGFDHPTAAMQAVETINIGDQWPENLGHYEQTEGWYMPVGTGIWVGIEPNTGGYFTYNNAVGDLALFSAGRALNVLEMDC